MSSALCEVSQRELMIMRGIAQDILRRSSAVKRLDAREALETYAEELLDRIEILEQASFGDFIKLLAENKRQISGSHLSVVPPKPK